VTAVWCGVCRRGHILKTCELCGVDLEHGHKLIHFCEPCKSVLREQRTAAMQTPEPKGDSAWRKGLNRQHPRAGKQRKAHNHDNN
jgi:hypothetical protein